MATPPHKLLVALILVAVLCNVVGAQTQAVGLKLLVRGVKNSKGVVGVLVFNSASGWPEDASIAFKSIAVPAEPGVTQLSIELPPGSYAVVVLHDENENRKLDRNLFGIPREQWGMSRNPRAKLSAPRFTQAQFELWTDAEMEIDLR